MDVPPVSTQPPPGRVLFVSHEATRTGAPMFLLHFLRWLRRNTDVGFEILLGKGGPLEEEFRKLGRVLRSADFHADGSTVAGFDLVYANTVCNTDLLEAIGARRVPVVTHVHELDMGYEWLGARRMARMLQQSHHLVACADAVARRLQQVFHVPAGRISRHYEMIDGESACANAAGADIAALRRDYDLPENAFVLTACGTCDFRKAPDLFLQASSHLKRQLGTSRPLRFLWIGAQNSPELSRLLHHDVRKLGLDQEFRLVGELPSPHGLIGLSNAFCLTSREDPFPLVMLEAAAIGKPVVCFAGSGGAGEFCSHGGGVAVPYLDPAAMAAVLRRWLENPAEADAVGQRGAASVREQFQVDVIAPALWSAIRGLPRDGTPLVPLQAALGEIYSGWNDLEAPQRSYRHAQLARAEVRRRAQRLIQSGQARAGAQLLIRTVNADLATRDAWTIFECLCEIGGDFLAIDPKQAEVMLTKARDIARTANLPLEQMLPPGRPAAAA